MRRHLLQCASLISAGLVFSTNVAPAQTLATAETTATARLIETGGTIFKVPLAYLIGRFPPKNPSDVLHLYQFQFAFWMPDGSPTEKDAPLLIGYRPKDGGHPSPGPDEYVVRVLPAQQIRSSSSGYVRDEGDRFNVPAAMFANMDGRNHFLTGGERFAVEHVYGLIGYLPKDPKFPRTTYLTSDGIWPQAFIECDTPSTKVTFPGCRANVFFAESEFAFRFLFPVERLSDWKLISLKASELMQSWRAPGGL